MAFLMRGEWYRRVRDNAWVSSNTGQIVRGLPRTATLNQIREASVRGKPTIEPRGANIFGDDRQGPKRRRKSLKSANAVIRRRKKRFK